MNDIGNSCSQTSSAAPRPSVFHWRPFPRQRLFLRKASFPIRRMRPVLDVSQSG